MTNQKDFLYSLFTKKEQGKLWILPAITNGDIDVHAERITTWLHPSGHLGYVIYNDGGNFTGIIFDRTQNKSLNKSDICEWCRCVNSASRISLFTRKTSDNRAHGIRLCSDLDCMNSIKNPNPNSIPESLTRDEKIVRYFDNLNKYFKL